MTHNGDESPSDARRDRAGGSIAQGSNVHRQNPNNVAPTIPSSRSRHHEDPRIRPTTHTSYSTSMNSHAIPNSGNNSYYDYDRVSGRSTFVNNIDSNNVVNLSISGVGNREGIFYTSSTADSDSDSSSMAESSFDDESTINSSLVGNYHPEQVQPAQARQLESAEFRGAVGQQDCPGFVSESYRLADGGSYSSVTLCSHNNARCDNLRRQCSVGGTRSPTDEDLRRSEARSRDQARARVPEFPRDYNGNLAGQTLRLTPEISSMRGLRNCTIRGGNFSSDTFIEFHHDSPVTNNTNVGHGRPFFSGSSNVRFNNGNFSAQSGYRAAAPTSFGNTHNPVGLVRTRAPGANIPNSTYVPQGPGLEDWINQTVDDAISTAGQASQDIVNLINGRDLSTANVLGAHITTVNGDYHEYRATREVRTNEGQGVQILRVTGNAHFYDHPGSRYPFNSGPYRR
ncbi:hypothetical protein BDN70DRAFT_885685 [Pholiota conissans]|uniref:Uncharacterized protein n=1 Tax=Pholiota conissans TaxID=109636 RepID=A0A9P5YTE1_9AGAR|nr:hypothetical protein BDN70DRAFT_885685 [Pholiota conissans]